MSKYIDAEKLIAKIEKRQEYLGDHNFHSMASEYDWLLTEIQSIQQEQPVKYETALEKAREWMPNVNQGGHAILINIFPELGEGLDPRYGGRKREQVDLDREITHIWRKCAAEPYDQIACLHIESFIEIARHFYELGLNARKK